MGFREFFTATLLLVVASCGAPPPPAPIPTGPSVLLITLDTTRADRLGPYGYALADTPTYDRIAAEGTVFERAYSTCPLTIPSHSTILTGKAPPTHGVRDNGDFILGDDAITLAERFQEAGYGTAAFTAAFPTQARWGFSQGFDVYHDPLERLPSQLDWRDQRRADEVVDDALVTLPQLREGPIFSWVHLFDAHWPYDPPEPFLTEHTGREYDGEIAFADAQVARLLEWWEKAYPNSIILITADHGEGLGDGGEQTHGFLLHDGTIRVPMILKGPGVPAGERISDAVGHTDIAPTLLNLVGLPLHEGLQGKDMREGGSDLMYSEALTGQFNLGLAPLHAWTDNTGRYMEGGWGGFYPVVDSSVSAIPDPEPAKESEEIKPLAARLQELKDTLGEGLAPSATLDAESLEMLSALGYVGGDPTAEAGEVDPRDVIDVIPLTWQARQLIGMGMFQRAAGVLGRLENRMPDTFGVDLLKAQLARRRGNINGAIEAFTDLYFRSQSSTTALQLAGLYATINVWNEAEDWYAEALRLQPASPEAMGGLVRAMYAQGKLALAEEAADRFLVIYPDHAELQLSRAEMYLHDGQPWNAIDDARSALDAMPYSPWAHAVTGQVLWELGESEDAIERLQDALRLNPYNASVRLSLSDCLLEVGRSAEAVRILAPLARLLPDNEEIQTRYTAARDALTLERETESHPKTSDLSRGG